MTFWSEIVGQQGAVRLLESAATDAVGMSHAWLITGPPGSGRSNLALRFAAALIARTPEERDEVWAQVRARTHPDLALLTTEKAVIGIDDARQVVTTAFYAPAQGRYRVIVVEDADRMPERTSNVLLKALEEPPERTIWLLCAPSEADLLPTIRSRTRALRLVTPGVSDVARLLVERDGVNPEIAERAARLAQSHIGMARRLATDPDALGRRDRSIELALTVDTLGAAMRAAGELLKVAEADAQALTTETDALEREEALRNLGIAPGAAIPPKLRAQVKTLEEHQKQRAKRGLRDSVDRVLTDLLSLARDVLLTSLGAGEELVNQEHAARIERLAQTWGPHGALSFVDALERARLRLARAITPGLVLEAAFAHIVADPQGVTA